MQNLLRYNESQSESDSSESKSQKSAAGQPATAKIETEAKVSVTNSNALCGADSKPHLHPNSIAPLTFKVLNRNQTQGRAASVMEVDLAVLANDGDEVMSDDDADDALPVLCLGGNAGDLRD